MRSGPIPREAALWAAGLTALLLGTLVYVTDRAAGSAWLLPTLDWPAGRGWFGAAAPWLPSAVHAFAFALLSAALLPPRRSMYAMACAAWVAIDLAFETGQHPAIATELSMHLESALPAAIAQPLARYFRAGTFDPADLGAVLLGGLAAWALLCWTHHEAEAAHEP